MISRDKKRKIVFLVITVIAIVGLGIWTVFPTTKGSYTKYSKFYEYVQEKQVDQAVISEKNVEFTLKNSPKQYVTENPGYEQFKEFLLLNDVAVQETNDSDNLLVTIFDLLFDLVFLVIFGGIGIVIYRFFRKQFPITKKSSDRFDEIAGMEPIKKDMIQLVELMKHPEEYAKRGIRQPHGILFAGPPGNGKTMFARALAGEAGINFIATKATDFQSMYMSIGPAKVKALFRKARRHAPCIVFIDEFDGIGEKRSYAGHAIDKENNRIITAMLNELDGFEKNGTGVIVIGATNNVKDLDPALIRAGRFDRKYLIGNPDLATRQTLIQMYTKEKRLGSDLSTQQLAEQFANLSCAQIEAILNEASLIADSKDSDQITAQEIHIAKGKVLC